MMSMTCPCDILFNFLIPKYWLGFLMKFITICLRIHIFGDFEEIE